MSRSVNGRVYSWLLLLGLEVVLTVNDAFNSQSTMSGRDEAARFGDEHPEGRLDGGRRTAKNHRKSLAFNTRNSRGGFVSQSNEQPTPPETSRDIEREQSNTRF